MRVTLAWTGAGQGEISLELAEPATVQAAIDAARELEPGIASAAANAVAIGMWGKVRSTDQLLREGDRVELYRALQADPKDARRANAQRAPRTTKKM